MFVQAVLVELTFIKQARIVVYIWIGDQLMLANTTGFDDHLILKMNLKRRHQIHSPRYNNANDMDGGNLLDNLAFSNIRKLRFLGFVSTKILRAVGNCQLEQLILRVNSPDDLHSVVDSGFVLRNIKEVVLGSFFRESYSLRVDDSAEFLAALTEALHAAFRALFHPRNGIRVRDITLLGLSIGKDLVAAGFNIDGARYWDGSRDECELGGESFHAITARDDCGLIYPL